MNIRNKAIGKWAFDYTRTPLFPSSSPSFRFLERQFSTTNRRTRSPWTPENKWGRNPPNPPARFSSLHSSRLLSLTAPGRRLQAPHHIDHSALTCLSSCTSRQTQLHFTLLTSGVKWNVCKNTATLRNAMVSVHSFLDDLISIWGQIQVFSLDITLQQICICKFFSFFHE